MLREDFGPVEKPVYLAMTAALLTFGIVITTNIKTYAARRAAIWLRTRGRPGGGSTVIA